MDEFVPRTQQEHVFATVAYLSAFWYGASVVSTLTSFMTQYFMNVQLQNQQINLLRKYLEQNRISSHLALRLTRNAKHALDERRQMVHEDFVEVIKLVSEPLRIDLHFEIYGPSLSAHPFFELYMAACPYVTKRICHKAMSMTLVGSGDTVFSTGEIPTHPRMFIVNQGCFEYRLGGSFGAEALTTGGEGDHIGPGMWLAEAVLWVSWTHRGMFTAAENCCLLMLDARDFQAIASHFEYSSDFDPKVYAERIVLHLNESDPDKLSDMITANELETHVLTGGRGTRSEQRLGKKTAAGGRYAWW